MEIFFYYIFLFTTLLLLFEISTLQLLLYLHYFREFSKKRFARAKRSEARYYFNRNDYEKAIEYYKEALEVNTYHSGAWFTLGCAYMRNKQMVEAAKAFGQVVSIDETQGEAWANMAASLSIQGKKAEAFSALQQAVKHNENSWRIWQNLMFVALETQKFKTFLEAIEKLLRLEQVKVQIFLNVYPK